MKDFHPDIAELLATRATEGLSQAQQEDLIRLLDEHQCDDSDAYDLAAAAAANAFLLDNIAAADDVPTTLKQKLRHDADRFFNSPTADVIEFRKPFLRRDSWGWATAAAIALLFIVSSLLNYPSTPEPEGDRKHLVANVNGTVVVPWAVPEDPQYANVVGNVVWNDDRQEGYMLLSGMPVNDPAKSQYQLWLVDSDRYTYPVDGGVFDVPEGAPSVVIPIDAKLAVSNPTVFAITREQPGGVVVSEGPLLVVASSG